MSAAVRDSLAALVAERRYGDVARLCDKAELEARLQAGGIDVPDWPYALHILGHVVNNDLELARLLWKRIPESAKKGNAELAAVWDLLTALWRRDYPAIGAALRSPAFGPRTVDAVAACAAAHRQATLQLLAASYATISVADVAQALALSEADALAAVSTLGWRPLVEDPAWVQVAPPVAAHEMATTDAMSLQKLLELAIASGS